MYDYLFDGSQAWGAPNPTHTVSDCSWSTAPASRQSGSSSGLGAHVKSSETQTIASLRTEIVWLRAEIAWLREMKSERARTLARANWYSCDQTTQLEAERNRADSHEAQAARARADKEEETRRLRNKISHFAVRARLAEDEVARLRQELSRTQELRSKAEAEALRAQARASSAEEERSRAEQEASAAKAESRAPLVPTIGDPDVLVRAARMRHGALQAEVRALQVERRAQEAERALANVRRHGVESCDRLGNGIVPAVADDSAAPGGAQDRDRGGQPEGEEAQRHAVRVMDWAEMAAWARGREADANGHWDQLARLCSELGNIDEIARQNGWLPPTRTNVGSEWPAAGDEADDDDSTTLVPDSDDESSVFPASSEEDEAGSEQSTDQRG